MRLAVPGVFWVICVRGERHARSGQLGSRPAGCGSTGLADVRRGGGVDDVNALMTGEASVVDVAVDIGFHVGSRRQQIPQRYRVDQSPRKMSGVASKAWVVMADDDRRFVGGLVESGRKPGKLLRAELSFRNDFFRIQKRVEQKKIGVARFDNRDVPGRDRCVVPLLFFQDVVKGIAIVVIAQGEMKVCFCVTKRAEQFREMFVITRFPFEQRQVAVNKNSSRLSISSNNFRHHLAQIAGDGRFGRLPLPDVRVIEQVNQIGVDLRLPRFSKD